jgi:hypothetical protein
MAGGIYVDYPYHPNPKCLIFSSLIMGLYWFSPKNKNIYLLPILFIISYVAMAWYDYRYNCDTIMYSGSSIGANTIDSIFKPQRRNEKHNKKKISENQEQEYLSRVYLFHILVVTLPLIYVGYWGQKSNAKLFPVILSLGIMGLFYHAFRYFNPRQTYNKCDCENNMP